MKNKQHNYYLINMLEIKRFQNQDLAAHIYLLEYKKLLANQI